MQKNERFLVGTTFATILKIRKYCLIYGYFFATIDAAKIEYLKIVANLCTIFTTETCPPDRY